MKLSIIRAAQRELCRSFMYVPGDKARMLAKAANMGAKMAPDIMTLDLEDSVSFSNKTLARENIFEFIKSGTVNNCSHSTICIRVNSVANESVVKDDLSFICDALKVSNYRLPQMINCPKIDDEKALLWFDEQIKSKVQTEKLIQPIKLSIIIESVQGIVNLKELLHHFINTKWSCFKLSNIIFGSDDYCASVGTSRSRSNDEVLYARQYIATIAAAYKIPAIDMVETDLDDMDYFKQNCLFGARIGFVGKQVIHPKQINAVHEAFSPTPEKISWAIDLLKEFEKNKEAGHGTFVFRSNMIDMPTIIQAQHIVEMSYLIQRKT